MRAPDELGWLSMMLLPASKSVIACGVFDE